MNKKSTKTTNPPPKKTYKQQINKNKEQKTYKTKKKQKTEQKNQKTLR